ncbi:putative holliday junction resolvase [Winogradskyella thalassocola]|nr:putative holliday junction resolvase [Winogradskyella thalassocola]
MINLVKLIYFKTLLFLRSVFYCVIFVVMGRILAIDYGTKRTGLAVTDEMQIIASGLTTVETKTLIPFLKNYISTEKVDKIVVGLPKQMDNTASESEVYIQKFLVQLTKAIPQIPVDRVDERFTSKMAFQTMIDSGLKKKQRQNKALVDEISATLILQSYLSSI